MKHEPLNYGSRPSRKHLWIAWISIWFGVLVVIACAVYAMVIVLPAMESKLDLWAGEAKRESIDRANKLNGLPPLSRPSETTQP